MDVGRTPDRRLDDFSVRESHIVETLDGQSSVLYLRRSIYEDQSPMKTFFLYTQDKKRLFVSALRRADGRIRARFLRPDGTCVFQPSLAIPGGSSYFQALFDLDFDKLTPGDYTIKIDYIDPEGKSLETWEQAYRIPKQDDPMFQPYVDPEADRVPAPWTAVQVSGSAVQDPGKPEARATTSGSRRGDTPWHRPWTSASHPADSG